MILPNMPFRNDFQLRFHPFRSFCNSRIYHRNKLNHVKVDSSPGVDLAGIDWMLQFDVIVSIWITLPRTDAWIYLRFHHKPLDSDTNIDWLHMLSITSNHTIEPTPTKHWVAILILNYFHTLEFQDLSGSSLAKIVEQPCDKKLGPIYSLKINFVKNVHVK